MCLVYSIEINLETVSRWTTKAHIIERAKGTTFAAAVFHPPEGAALLGPVATAPAWFGVTGGVIGLTGLVAAAGVRVGVCIKLPAGVSVGVAVVAAVAAVEPMGAPEAAGEITAAVGETTAAAGAGAAQNTSPAQ